MYRTQVNRKHEYVGAILIETQYRSQTTNRANLTLRNYSNYMCPSAVVICGVTVAGGIWKDYK